MFLAAITRSTKALGQKHPSKFRIARKLIVSLEANFVELYKSLKDFGFYS